MTSKIKELKDKISSKETPKGPIVESNIEEHREQTIKSAKKFKYPMQQSRHIILITASVVFVLALAIFMVISWWRLYSKQDTSDFYYTATKFIPIAVAEVDGEPVNYSSYMRRVRASVYYLENQESRDLSTEDGKRELEHTKRVNLNEAEKSAFAIKIAREKTLTVSDQEISTNIQNTLNAQAGGAISERAFENSLWRYYGWTMDDYRQITRERLLLRKVSFAIDSEARDKANDIRNQLVSGGDFAALAAANSSDEGTKANGGDAGTMAVDNVDDDGLIAAARDLEPGGISNLVEGVDAFYVIKLFEKTDTTVHYSLIKISLSQLDKQFASLKEQGKIKEHIEINSEE